MVPPKDKQICQRLHQLAAATFGMPHAKAVFDQRQDAEKTGALGGRHPGDTCSGTPPRFENRMGKICRVDGLERSEGVEPQPPFTNSGRIASNGESKEFRRTGSKAESFFSFRRQNSKNASPSPGQIWLSRACMRVKSRTASIRSTRPDQPISRRYIGFNSVKFPTDWAVSPVRAKISSRTSGIKKKVGPLSNLKP